MRLLVAFAALIMSLAACADAGVEKYQAGKHYQVLDNPVRTANPDKIEVTEVFWYGCGHCYHFETPLKPWVAALADDVAFVKSPAMWHKTMELHARAYYAAKALGVEDQLNLPLFEALNVRKQKLDSESEIKALFEANGVDGAKFDKVFNSFGVTGQVRQADARARSYRISGTPELVVEGKYRISARDAGGQAEMLDVASFLIEKERAARAAQ